MEVRELAGVSGASSHWLGRPPRVTRFPVAEAAVVRAAAAVAAWVGPRADAAAIRRVFPGLLARTAADPTFARLPSVLWVSAATLLGRRPDPGHLFAYVPADLRQDERLGLVVALHGHGGNPHVGLYAWAAFADWHRFAVVAPTFGYGNWEHPAGVMAVHRCLDFALNQFSIDPARVYLAGLSQGGAGVGRAGAALADRFAGLIFLSPTMEPGVLGLPEFVAGWRGRPVIVFHGDADRNVTPATVDAGVELMQRNGADVTYHRTPGAGHFLFFADRDRIAARIGEWLTSRRITAGV